MSINESSDIMREEWDKTAKSWGYSTEEHGEQDECWCSGDSAVIHLGEKAEMWAIGVSELDVQVAVCVEDGMIKDIIANADRKACCKLTNLFVG